MPRNKRSLVRCRILVACDDEAHDGGQFRRRNEARGSYFLDGDGDCKLTLMIGERSRDEQDGAPPAARLKVAVEADTTASLDTEEGKSLQFACKAGAQAMTATVIDRVAFLSRSEIILS